MERTFRTVWYRPEENRWRSMRLVAFCDRGTLVVYKDSAEFTGKNERFRIVNVNRISFGKRGQDWVNNWVKIEYGSGKTAFFADGSWLGWRGIFGGTRELFGALQHLARCS